VLSPGMRMFAEFFVQLRQVVMEPLMRGAPAQ